MIAGSISLYAMPQISNLFYRDGKHELQGILRSLAVIGAILVGLAFLLVVAGENCCCGRSAPSTSRPIRRCSSWPLALRSARWWDRLRISCC